MAISNKSLDGLFILAGQSFFRVISREPNKKGEDWPFFIVWDINKDIQWMAHEDCLREGQQCIDGSLPPKIGKPPKREILPSIFD